MSNLKKIGVIGTGWIFQNEHVLGYLETDSGYIACFHDVSEEAIKDAMNLYISGMKKRLKKAKTPEEKLLCQKALECKYYNDVNELLDVVDGVDICTPPQYHTYYAKMAADKDKAVLCEKPLARTYPDAEEALKSLKDVPFYIFTQVIYNPIFKKGKELIDTGVIGEIKKMRCCHATLDLSHTWKKKRFGIL